MHACDQKFSSARVLHSCQLYLLLVHFYHSFIIANLHHFYAALFYFDAEDAPRPPIHRTPSSLNLDPPQGALGSLQFFLEHRLEK